MNVRGEECSGTLPHCLCGRRVENVAEAWGLDRRLQLHEISIFP
jgi:hypothetical protein